MTLVTDCSMKYWKSLKKKYTPGSLQLKEKHSKCGKTGVQRSHRAALPSVTGRVFLDLQVNSCWTIQRKKSFKEKKNKLLPGCCWTTAFFLDKLIKKLCWEERGNTISLGTLIIAHILGALIIVLIFSPPPTPLDVLTAVFLFLFFFSI